jgi:methyl-accepting chemotaxis protein
MPFINSVFSYGGQEEESKIEEHDKKEQHNIQSDDTPSYEEPLEKKSSSITDTTKGEILLKTADNLLVNTEEGLSAIEELKSTMESIAAAAEESAGAAEESLGAVTQIKQSTSSVLAKSKASALSIKELEGSIQLAAKKVTESSQNMLRIAASADNVSEVGIRLSKAGEEISKTVNLITKLAKRTSLLALNAAIEATRAEDKGKSFSIMAKEIRALSLKSNAYAQEIKTVVTDIESNVGSVQTTIVKTKDLVSSASVNASKNAKSMQSLIGKLLDIVQEVKCSLEEFEALDSEMVQMQLSSETIASAAEESAGAVSEVTQIISMQATAFEQSNTAAKMLEGLAKRFELHSNDGDIINDLASAAEELSSAIEEIENSMQQSMVALSQIQEAAEISKEDAKKNSNIAKKAQQIATKVKETVREVNTQIQDIKEAFAKNVEAIAQAGIDSKANLANTSLILQEAKNVRKSIKYLKKILRKIELTNVQTAALSINGSVEAMRIGEFGEGFSVVSSDIQSLAENSEQSLDQINDIVENLEDETESIIEAIDKMEILGIKEAESLIVLAEEMQKNSQEIEKNIGIFADIDAELNEIENALSQAEIGATQTLTAAEISFSNAKESNIAAQHIIETAQRMAESVTELIEVAAAIKGS